MTNKEAIKTLEELKELHDVDPGLIDDLDMKALDKAIEALTKDNWFDHITKDCLKARKGEYVLYKVDYLLDHLAREVYIMERAKGL